jgi:predicted pyridoxine 5'-phosphate oxidase superfamily flavin-nucleotide-binding protein
MGIQTAMFTWSEFEAAAPDVAAPARELIERWRYLLVGTIRRDGTPRISPVEAHFVEGHLILVMMARSLKAADVLRDPRIVLNAPISDPADPGAELKLRGRAVVVEDATLRQATADTIERASGWRPPDRWHFFAVDLADVAHIVWKQGEQRMTHWRRTRSVKQVTKRIDLE